MAAFRVSFLLYLTVFAVFAFGLYLLKYEAQSAHQELAQKRQILAQEKETIKLLKAEWAYLTRPDRLQKLQQKHLRLQHVSADQSVGVTFDIAGEHDASAIGWSIHSVSSSSGGGR